MPETLQTVFVKHQRHVDALIARYERGWHWFRNVRDPSWHSLLNQSRSSIDWELITTVEDDTLLMGNYWDWRVPKFSSDMGVIWEEIERLQAAGFAVNLRSWTNGDWRAEIRQQADVGKVDADTWEGFSQQAPLALCTALLRRHHIRLVWLPSDTQAQE